MVFLEVLKSEKFVSMLAAEHDSDMFPDNIYGALAYASESMEDMAYFLDVA